MANDVNLNNQILNTPALKEPGFFNTLRNPLDLWMQESIPASMSQWITGNTKKKQAQEALNFLRRNADQPNTPEYQDALKLYKRFGYLLEEGGDFDFSEFTKLIKQHPGLVGAEFINAIIADPYLVAVPFFGWGRIGRATVNSIRKLFPKKLKILKDVEERAIIPDLTVGGLQALSLPLFYSINYQLSENRTLSGPRTTVETTVGATAAMLFSGIYHGTARLVSTTTGKPYSAVSARAKEALQNDPSLGKIDPKTGEVPLVELLHKEFAKEKPLEVPLFANKQYAKSKNIEELSQQLLATKTILYPAYENADKKETIKNTKVEMTQTVFPINSPYLFNYLKELNKVTKEYIKKYKHCDYGQEALNVSPNIKIQKYKPNEHYSHWHSESTGFEGNNNRILVFSTFLNDIIKGGETEFFYQKKKIKPKIGKTIIFPAFWTHTHKVHLSKETKYIITGWYSYVHK